MAGIGTRHHDLAGLQRLAQRVEHARRKFGQFVEEEDTVVGEAGLARPGFRRPPPTMDAGEAV